MKANVGGLDKVARIVVGAGTSRMRAVESAAMQARPCKIFLKESS